MILYLFGFNRLLTLFGIWVVKAEDWYALRKWQLYKSHSSNPNLPVTSIVDTDYNLGLNSTCDDETPWFLKS